MKKTVVALLLIAAVVGARPAVKRLGRKMSEHCEQMAAQCKQMLEQTGRREETAGSA